MHQPHNLCFKEEVDKYFTSKYQQLYSTTTKIINKHNRDLEASNVIAAAYLYILESENDIKAFSEKHNKTLEHTIYSFCRQYIDKQLYWNKSQINCENDKLYNKVIQLNIGEESEEQTIEEIRYEYKHNIYTEDFIQDFYSSLSKLDAICFKVYYFDGIDNAKDFAIHFDISLSSAYISINRLKQLLKQYITKHQIN